MPVPTKVKSRYIAGIDGLRGIAVLSVIFYHINSEWASGGLLGVVIFFVLSGYLITDICLGELKRTQTINLKDFWIRRIQRLFPALLVMLICVTTWITVFDNTLLSKIKGDIISTLFYLSNWWYIFHKVSYFESFGTPSPVTHLWSLAVEEQFYIIWPFLLAIGIKLLRTSKFLWLTASIAIMSACLMSLIYQPGIDPSRVYYGTDTRVFSLLFGSCLAIIWPSKRLSIKAPRNAIRALDFIGVISLAILLLLICQTNQYSSFLYRGGMVLTSIVSVLLIATIVHPASILSKLLGFKPLRWIGVRSYGMYLWHYPIIVLSTPAVEQNQFNILRMAIQIAAIIILSTLSWHFIENPIRMVGLKEIWRRIKSDKYLLIRLPIIEKILIGSLIVMLVVSSIGILSTDNQNKKTKSNNLDSTEIN